MAFGKAGMAMWLRVTKIKTWLVFEKRRTNCWWVISLQRSIGTDWRHIYVMFHHVDIIIVTQLISFYTFVIVCPPFSCLFLFVNSTSRSILPFFCSHCLAVWLPGPGFLRGEPGHGTSTGAMSVLGFCKQLEAALRFPISSHFPVLEYIICIFTIYYYIIYT